MKSFDKRKLALRLGVALLAAAIFLLILAIIPTSDSSGLPNWIIQVKPSESGGIIFRQLDGQGVTVIEQTRRLKMSIAEFSQKLRSDLRQQPEWRETTASAKSPTWTRDRGMDTRFLWAMQEGDAVVVHTNWAHNATWLETAKAKVRSFFGAKD